jgi:hypothetical protein
MEGNGALISRISGIIYIGTIKRKIDVHGGKIFQLIIYQPKKDYIHMLKIKCFDNFDGPYSVLLISGEAEDFLRASAFYQRKTAHL